LKREDGVVHRNPLAVAADRHGLAEAIVDTVREPLIVLDRDLRVIAASRSFYRTFGVEPGATVGRTLFDLGEGQWNIPALRTVLEEIIPKQRTVEAYEVEHEFPVLGRRVMLLNARRVRDETGSDSAILVAIEDVTQRRDSEREKDELLRQKEVLLREMQHRVANSLQIIASILLLKARTVQSEEIRLHLQDAHQRVMSVATVQQQLQASGLNERIEIGPYLMKLCDSLGKSMVGERPLAIKVEATSGTAVSSEAVSLGLIVTELVINALKHAFPAGEKGGIRVSYAGQGSGWHLSVSDDGSGAPEEGSEPSHTGLGTSIVEALAHQLKATVQKSSGPQGTTVTIVASAAAEPP
jgi:chemotaxis protein methyltransferase CheR